MKKVYRRHINWFRAALWSSLLLLLGRFVIGAISGVFPLSCVIEVTGPARHYASGVLESRNTFGVIKNIELR